MTIRVASQATLVRSLPTWLIATLLGLLALLPRGLGLADFFTIDEPYHWIGRVARFADALALGNWAATNQTGHPGVTTMWLGALGRWLAAQAGISDPGWAGGGAGYLAALRLPLALANSLAVVSGYLLLRRLLRPTTALLAALLWATSPFLVAHSRLLHLDALLTSLMTLSLLALLVATDDGELTIGGSPSSVHHAPSTAYRPLRWLLASGVLAGLALLTKAPALVLLPFVGIVLLVESSVQLADWQHPRALIAGLPATIRRYLCWLAAALLTVAIGWPAVWVDPLGALGGVLHEVLANGGEEHHSGNFFLGQAVGDPGPLFYPAVVLWRSTPWMLLGLLGLPLIGWQAWRNRSQRQIEGRSLGWLLAFVLAFATLMCLEPKKFDRYLLPIWPGLEVLAAAGLVAMTAWLRQRLARWGSGIQAVAGGAGWLLLTLVCCANLAWYHPYTLAYFNPLLGGGAVAQRVMLVGWGEGLETVGAWLRTRPDLGRGPVLSWIPPALAPFVPESTLVLDLRPALARQASSYAVLYSRSVQRQESPEAEALVRTTPPLFSVQRFGIEYASVYQLPRPFTLASGAVFGNGLELRGFSTQKLANTLVITPSWNIQASQPGGQFVFLHLLNEAGQRVAQRDAPLDQGMFAAWQAGQQFDSPLPLVLPADLPAGRYRVVLGVYNPADGARWGLAQATPLPTSLDGPHALELTSITLP